MSELNVLIIIQFWDISWAEVDWLNDIAIQSHCAGVAKNIDWQRVSWVLDAYIAISANSSQNKINGFHGYV